MSRAPLPDIPSGTPSDKVSDNLRGSLFMILAMAAFAVEDALFKSVTRTLQPGVGTFLFGLTGLALFSAWSLLAGERVLVPEMRRPRLLLRSGIEIAGRLFFALPLAYAPLATTSATLQATPLVVIAGAALFFGTRVAPVRWIAVGLGFVGVLMVIRPTPAAFDATALFAVAATFGFAGRDLATRASPPSVTARQLGVLGFLVVTAAGLILIGFDEGPFRLPTLSEAARLALTGLFGVTAYQALTQAMRTGEVAVVTPFRYTRLLFALLFAVLLFGERLDGWTIAGMALIVGTGVFALLPGPGGDRGRGRGNSSVEPPRRRG